MTSSTPSPSASELAGVLDKWLASVDPPKLANTVRQAAILLRRLSDADEWQRGFPGKSGQYLVYLSDGEQIVTYWNDGRGKNADTWGDERPHGWGAIRDWQGHVKAWRPLPAPPSFLKDESQ